ncbi:unnamed protein product [Mytilus coruscus]|uniref:ZMYM2-like/QRICH1 C-terminal domain-containing protein n=1 Tax=Mytilus coruscus TaxID=42192 RepID=A0A6J8CHA6_MYTCO|nr:unnamed protein product [Mytilus coruscus]
MPRTGQDTKKKNSTNNKSTTFILEMALKRSYNKSKFGYNETSSIFKGGNVKLANTRKQADVISVDEETALYHKGILGMDNSQQLLDTLLYLCGLHFALRGGNEHRRLRINFNPLNPQITGPFQDKDAKLRYLLYKEDVSKANAGGLKHRKVAPKCVRALENPENRNKCIVTVFEKYKSLWHCETSIGLTGKRTNHSLRASAATRLYNAGIEEQPVAETTDTIQNDIRKLLNLIRKIKKYPDNIQKYPDNIQQYPDNIQMDSDRFRRIQTYSENIQNDSKCGYPYKTLKLIQQKFL